MIWLWFVIGIVIVIALALVSLYNKLVYLRRSVRRNFSQTDALLTRRYELVRNLLDALDTSAPSTAETRSTVADTLDEAKRHLTSAHSDPTDAKAIKALRTTDTTLDGQLDQLSALIEADPDLKSNNNIEAAREELATTQDKLARAREPFNNAVTVYNNACQNFPANVIAANFGFRTAAYIDIGDSIEQSTQHGASN